MKIIALSILFSTIAYITPKEQSNARIFEILRRGIIVHKERETRLGITGNRGLDLSRLAHPKQLDKELLSEATEDMESNSAPLTDRKRRSVSYLAKQFFLPAVNTETGLEALSHRDFIELARSKRAFYHATETELREGWWSSLLASDFLRSSASRPLREFLKAQTKKGVVTEIGPGAQLIRHNHLFRNEFGARHYLSVDLNRESEKRGAIYSDALTFFSLFPSQSVNVIVAFGVFNEPMSLQFPALSPPHFYIPAKYPEVASRAHCEHEYVRRLAREMVRVLRKDGVLLGDGLHSRGFESEVETYLRAAGFFDHEQGHATLQNVNTRRFQIRDPFFFKIAKV
jgi:hypothetical protein